MAQRWTLNEDIVVCKYCVENPWAYDSNEHIDILTTRLEKVGSRTRSKNAIKQRAYAYEILLEGRRLSWVPDQVAMVYEMLREGKQKTNGIKAYIREVYRPQESLGTLEDASLLSNLTGVTSDLLEMKRTIDYQSTFPMVLQKYVDLKGIKKHNTMCRGIGMKPDTFSAILRGKYKEVKKDNVLRLCVGLGLHVHEAEELLESAGYMFSKSVMKDVVIKAFLYDGIYSVVAINAELYDNDEEMLFENYVIEYEV